MVKERVNGNKGIYEASGYGLAQASPYRFT